MASEKKITMREYNGTDYDTLYPKTIAEQVDGIYSNDEVLSNSTKALYGLTDSAVPDDALALLSRFHNGLGNEYVWEKIKNEKQIVVGSYASTQIAMGATAVDIQYSDSIAVDESTGAISLVNPSSVNGNASTLYNSYWSNFVGKYLTTPYNIGVIYHVASDSSATFSNAAFYLTKCAEVEYKTVYTSDGYVNSPDPNAYPPAVSDGYTYTALGQLGAKVQIATGSYTGTGTYGASNPNSLTFDFEPKIVIIYRANVNVFPFFSPNNYDNATGYATIYFDGVQDIKCNAYGNSIKFTASGNNLSWYSSGNALQLNENNCTYNYIAIG